MGWLRKQYEKTKKGVKADYKHYKKVKAVEKKSYKKAQIKEASKFGKRKAAYESKQKLKKVKHGQGFTFKGFAGPTKKQPSASLGVADYLTGNTSTNKKGRKKQDFDMRLF